MCLTYWENLRSFSPWCHLTDQNIISIYELKIQTCFCLQKIFIRQDVLLIFLWFSTVMCKSTSRIMFIMLKCWNWNVQDCLVYHNSFIFLSIYNLSKIYCQLIDKITNWVDLLKNPRSSFFMMIHESVTYIQIGCIILIKFIEGLEGDKRS